MKIKTNKSINTERSQKMKEWCIRIKLSYEEEKFIKKKILDSAMKIGEYTKKSLMES